VVVDVVVVVCVFVGDHRHLFVKGGSGRQLRVPANAEGCPVLSSSGVTATRTSGVRTRCLRGD
jgi:hypothetical protein